MARKCQNYQIFGIKFLSFDKKPKCQQDLWRISANVNITHFFTNSRLDWYHDKCVGMTKKMSNFPNFLYKISFFWQNTYMPSKSMGDTCKCKHNFITHFFTNSRLVPWQMCWHNQENGEGNGRSGQ